MLRTVCWNTRVLQSCLGAAAFALPLLVSCGSRTPAVTAPPATTPAAPEAETRVPQDSAASAAAPGADEWQMIEREHGEQFKKADASVKFAGTIYRDKSEAALVMDCTPSGPEVCFDGLDNDCNGRYDEVSCGYSTGVLQWTVSWKGAADLDLRVVGPHNAEVSREQPQDDNAKLALDRQCHGVVQGKADCADGNIENVFVPPADVPVAGTYQAIIEVSNTNGVPSSKPIQARISGRIGARTWHTDIKLAPVLGASYTVAYPVGADADNDSVADAHDACPNEKGCWFADLKYRGCPDEDRDGVPDSIDACPKKTGLTQDNPKKNGCPLEFGKAWVTNAGVKINSRIEFDFAKAALRPDAKKIIGDVASAIKARPGVVTKIAVDGHTDNVGTEEDNLDLSNRRAQSVIGELNRLGIAEQLLLPRGFGETKPVRDNSTDAGRKENRRVEFVVLEPKPPVWACW